MGARWSASRTSRRPPQRTFAGSLSGGMAPAAGGVTPTPDRPSLGIYSGLPMIFCSECFMAIVGGMGNLCERCREDAAAEEYGAITVPDPASRAVEYIGVHGGSITGNLSNCRRNETRAHGGCSFKTQEEYEEILRERGLLSPAATPEQGSGYPVLLEPEQPMGNPKIVAAMEDLKHEMVAQRLAIAQLKTEIEDFMGNKLGAGDKVEKATKNKLAIAQLETDIQDFKGNLGAGDRVQKAAMTDSIVRWAKAIVKWFFVAIVVVLRCANAIVKWFFEPEQPMGNPKIVAAMEDLKHDMVAQKLAIAQLKWFFMASVVVLLFCIAVAMFV